MQIDTGAALTIVSEETLYTISSGLDLNPTDVSICMYISESLLTIRM